MSARAVAEALVPRRPDERYNEREAKMMFNAAPQLKRFQQDGVLHVPKALDVHAVEAVGHAFWAAIEETFGIHLDQPNTWFKNPNNPAGDSRAKRLGGMSSIMQRLQDSGLLRSIERSLEGTFANIFDQGQWAPTNQWFSLLGFPGTETETNVPSKSWHCDQPIVAADREPWSVFVFVFLDEVRTETGPTLAVAGSHRSAEHLAHARGRPNAQQIRAFEHVNAGLGLDPETAKVLCISEVLKSLSQEDAWFRGLSEAGAAKERIQKYVESTNRFRNESQRVVEIAGAPGDIVLFDPRCLHTFSANISNRPRQVLRFDFKRLPKAS